MGRQKVTSELELCQVRREKSEGVSFEKGVMDGSLEMTGG